MMKKIMLFNLFLLVIVPILLIGCAPQTAVQSGAVRGAAVGAAAGQILGRDTESTLIGAGAGALGGALLNDSLQNRYRN